MAKFNIAVELDWIDENGGIDDIVKTEIISAITDKLSNEITEEIIKKAQKTISEKVLSSIDTKVNEITEQLLNKRFDVTDQWGDVKKSNTSVIELLKGRLDDFLNEKVDKDGRVTSYNGVKRIDWVISKNIDCNLQATVNNAAAEVKKGLEKYIDTTLKAQIGEKVAKIIGLDKIVNQK